MKISNLLVSLLLAGSVGVAVAAVSFPTWQGSAPPMSEFYCLPAAPTAPVDTFVAPAMVQPTSSVVATNSLERTDGTYYYVTTFTTGTGLIASIASCPVRYTSQQ